MTKVWSTSIPTGRADEISATAEKIGRKVDTDRIADTKDDEQAAAKAVELIRKGEADFLQKGLLHTSALLKAVVNREKGLRTGKNDELCRYVSNEEAS